VELLADKRWCTLPKIRRAACRQQLDQYTLTNDRATGSKKKPSYWACPMP
jgi:hypothetical protein